MMQQQQTDQAPSNQATDRPDPNPNPDSGPDPKPKPKPKRERERDRERERERADSSASSPTSASSSSSSSSPSAGQDRPRSWEDVPAGQRKKRQVPGGLWMRCVACGEMIYRKQTEDNLHVCPQCGHHYRISAAQRIEQLCDPGSFESLFEEVGTGDPLKFVDLKSYPQRMMEAASQTNRTEACLCGRGYIKGRRVMVASLDLTFMMGSMGSAVGERITRTIEQAHEESRPLVIVSCSGGARMQESGLSLMQMAKTSAALGRFDEAGGLFISVLTDPTTGGVTASFAMLGDVILAEPGALIGLAGPRVIQQTIRQELPEGFQRAEFLKQVGFVDRVVPRHELRSEISRIVDYAGK